MNSDWAADNLLTIRTLMERSALYRRALAPVMLLAGVVGLLAALLAGPAGISNPRTFVLYWYGVSLVPLAGSFIIVRRQAWRDGEPLWSSPARRVTLAFVPAWTAGLVIGLNEAFGQPQFPDAVSLPALWAILYGCGIHAAGFFTPRGLRWFGGGLIGAGLILLVVGAPERGAWAVANGAMGVFFGALHLLGGGYLYFTESMRNRA